MPKYFCFVLLILFFLALTTKAQQSKITILRERGISVDWDYSGTNRIAYATKETDKYYDIHICKPDGTNDTCVTCDHAQLPNRHISCP